MQLCHNFLKRTPDQGCQIVCFQTNNPNLGKFFRVLLWKILVYFMTIRSILRPLKIFYEHLVYFVVIWYIFPRFGILDQEKSGNPAPDITGSWLHKLRHHTHLIKSQNDESVQLSKHVNWVENQCHRQEQL
jgi:hypothetical protein